MDWNQLPGESARARALFSSYLALGPGRSLPTMARAGLASLSYLKRLSAHWHWRERALTWQASQTTAIPHEEAFDIRAQRLKDARALQQLACAQLERWLVSNPQEASSSGRRLTPSQAMQIWQAGFHLERAMLPPVLPMPEQVDIAKQLREVVEEPDVIDSEHGRRDDEGETWTDAAGFAEELARWRAAVEDAGLRGPALDEMEARFRRWLWLPDQGDLTGLPHPLASAEPSQLLCGKLDV